MAGVKARVGQAHRSGRRAMWHRWRSFGRVVIAFLVLAMILSLILMSFRSVPPVKA